jgi:hypothetical protein
MTASEKTYSGEPTSGLEPLTCSSYEWLVAFSELR